MAKTKKFAKTIGSRAEVFHGVAERTGYGVHALKKKDLMKNKNGRIVSKKKQATAKREKRLEKAGYKPKKGKFVLMRKSMRATGKKAKRSKGKKGTRKARR